MIAGASGTDRRGRLKGDRRWRNAVDPQECRGVGVDALVAALECAVIGDADPRPRGDALLRQAAVAAQLLEPTRVAMSDCPNRVAGKTRSLARMQIDFPTISR